MRNKNQRGNPPGLPRITNIEVAQKNLPLRIALLALAIVIAIGAFGFGISKLLTTEPGWKTIKSNSAGLNCGEDFVLNYYLGADGASATAENKQLTALYTEATEDAYQLFNNDFVSDELRNIRYVNDHINTEITVDPALYRALSAVVAAENRSIYLAPAYAQYSQLFVCESDIEAVQYDPIRQPETADFISQVAQFACDPQMIDIQLLGDNKINLQVAQAYLDFMQENEIEYVLDFSWMTNAFVCDYIADRLVDNGFTNGYLVSFDGFTRNLCPANQIFSLNVFQRIDSDILVPATVNYPGGYSVVALRDFPITEADRWHYYAFTDGRIANLMIDPVDGKEKSAISSMVCYSETKSCSQILLNMAPLYIADMLDTQKVNALAGEGIYTVYPDNHTVYSNGSVQIQLYEGYAKETIE